MTEMRSEQNAAPASGLKKAYTYIPRPLPPMKEDGNILSPLPGRVILLNAKEGQSVRKDELLAVVEAMKMENEITAPFDGITEQVLVSLGDTVPAKALLMKIRGEEE